VTPAAHAPSGDGLQPGGKLTGVRDLPPTIPSPIVALLPALLDDLRATLGDELVGVYLYGSAITGGFDGESSDLDLVIVTAPDVATMDLARIEALHARLATREPDWADRLDLAYVGRDTLGAFRSGGAVASISHDDPLQLYVEADDWLQTWYLVRETAVAVFGPDAVELVPPIGDDEFVRAVRRSALELAQRAQTDERDGWRAFALLTLCRVLVTTPGGPIVSKAEAGAGAIRDHPELRPAIEAALAFREHRGRVPTPDVDRPLVLAAIGTLAAEVRRRGDP
jgi:hypothetical protein